ncbi:nucleotidyl transferase AbiEii/AbiGii toxin family protein [Candidatus Gottesmanbacteria bacterium]|nr:nucleotidyl transferase AbiEii/AbiGii toxin family protein [Candidatus Gottesmanbacteria bacterium]
MTNITADWPQILRFAKRYGLPESKKRAIIREFLQTKIISLVYSQAISKNLYFVGGTALRLLHGLDRFSEDLDFDAPGLSHAGIKNIIKRVYDDLKKENIRVDFYQNKTAKKTYYELRFPTVLFETGITPNQEEKLAIKLDIEPFWKGQSREIVLVNRFGFLGNVVTKTVDQFVVEKLAAYIGRKETAARDVYDLVWLASYGAKADNEFAKQNGLSIKNMLRAAKQKFSREKRNVLKNRLQPFLLDEKNTGKIDFFSFALENMGKPETLI